MTRPSKKILMLCGYRIFPPSTGGHVHSTTIARALARMGHEVVVYCLAGRREDYSGMAWLAGSVREVPIEPRLVEVTDLGPVFGLLQTISRRFGVPRIGQFELLRHGLVPRRLRRELRKADIVISDFPFCPPVPGPWTGKPWFMVSHELEFKLFGQGSAMERRFAGWMQRVEEAAPRRYRDIFVCAQEDRDFFRAHDPSGALQLPYIRCGVDCSNYVAVAGDRERVRAELGLGDEDLLIVFSGSRYGPNLESLEEVRAFCRAEAAFLQERRVHLLALGSMVPAPVREGAFIATGPVPEVLPYFAAADAGLNPITRGSGSNVKLFEYLAARLPVISTPFGVRGTNLVADVDFLPYEAPALKPVLERFLRERTRAQWREHADQVLARHYRACDINELVKDAVAQRPEFAG